MFFLLFFRYYTQKLGNGDANNVLRTSRHLIHIITGAFLISQTWTIFYEEGLYVMSKIITSKNYKDSFTRTYKKAGESDTNYRTCSELNEMQEIINFQDIIIKS